MLRKYSTSVKALVISTLLSMILPIRLEAEDHLKVMTLDEIRELRLVTKDKTKAALLGKVFDDQLANEVMPKGRLITTTASGLMLFDYEGDLFVCLQSGETIYCKLNKQL